MKQMFLFAALVCGLFCQTALAKDTRIGVINSEQILVQFSEYQAGMRTLQEEKTDWDRQIREREQEIEAEAQEFRMQENTMTPVSRAENKASIDRRIAELEEFRGEIYAEPQGRFFRRNQEVMEPLIEKVNLAIKEVAEEEGYDLIIDNSMSIVVYAREESIDINLSAKILDKLQGTE